jgi:signal transduction histidine kinase/ligand-binding sensor domain-containing protein
MKLNRNKSIAILQPGRLFIVLLSILSVCFSSGAHAQQYYFKHYNIGDGLAQTQATSIYQDSSRYLWIGTQSGVSRFDGTEFKNYTKADGINGNIIYSTFEDAHRILVRTGIGLSAIQNDRVQKFFLKAGLGKDNRLIRDGNGRVWLINGTHLNLVDKNKLKAISVTGDTGEVVNTIAINNQKQLHAVVAKKGIYRFDNNKWLCEVPFDRNLPVTSILFDASNEHKIYLLTGNQIYVSNDGVISAFKNPLLDTLKARFWCIAQDGRGTLWVGTTKGACYLLKDNPIYFSSENGLTSNGIQDILTDKEGIIWLATNGEGIYKFQGLNFVDFSKVNDVPFQPILSVGGTTSGHILLGTFDQGLLEVNNWQIKHIRIPSTDPGDLQVLSVTSKKGVPTLLTTRANNVWAIDNGKFKRIGQIDESIFEVVYDNDNSPWLAALSGCYYFRNGQFHKVTNFTHTVLTVRPFGTDSVLVGNHFGISLIVKNEIDKKFGFAQLANSSILCLLRYKNLVVAGTLGEGIFVMDIAKHTLKNYSITSGLKSNDIYSLCEVNDGTIWAGTGKGVAKFTINTKDLSAHIFSDIIPNPVNEFNQNAIFYDNNRIWLGRANGLSVYQTESIAKWQAHSNNPFINIEAIKLIDQDNIKNGVENIVLNTSNTPQVVKFNYSHKHIVISFKGIYFTDPDNLLYQYRLKGLDKEFSSPSKLSRVEYTSLAPGGYLFEVKVTTAIGTASAIKQIHLEILPAFYQTVYFYIFLIILFASIIIFIQIFFSRRKNRQRLMIENVKKEEQIKIRRQTAEDFHDDIGNKLTRIVVLSDILERKSKSGYEEQKEIINQIKENAATLFTGTKDILWALDPQSDNLFEIFSYIKNFAIDIFDNTDICLNFEEFDVKYSSVVLPLEFSRNISMIFKELLNNILKHAHAHNVTISACTCDENVKITISDDGIGFDKNLENKGRGLNNIKTRAQRINGCIDITSLKAGGTRVTLTFNLTQQIDNFSLRV